MELKNVVLLIADISGYTQFIQDNRTSLLHAEEIISELLETIVVNTDTPLQVNKFEGDAVLLFAELVTNQQIVANNICEQIKHFIQAFKAKATNLAEQRVNCGCAACQGINGLQLKVIVHQGEVAYKKIRQFEELAGEAVILVHRLLKNTVPAHEYVLFSEAFSQLISAPPFSRITQHQEQCAGLGVVNVSVCYPE